MTNKEISAHISKVLSWVLSSDEAPQDIKNDVRYIKNKYKTLKPLVGINNAYYKSRSDWVEKFLNKNVFEDYFAMKCCLENVLKKETSFSFVPVRYSIMETLAKINNKNKT